MNQSSLPSADVGNELACSTWSKRLLDFAVRRRIHISLVVFVALIAEDVFNGVKPHDIANLAEHHAHWGVGLVMAGLVVRSWAAGTLHKWAELTTAGPYGVVRHPLYIGSFFMMIGFCTIIDDGENILFVMGPFLALYLMAVFREEHRLAERFPASWTSYASAVPRFMPRRIPAHPFAAWSAGQWLANREYQAVAASFCGLIALEMWRLA